jgi:hypothetical protein
MAAAGSILVGTDWHFRRQIRPKRSVIEVEMPCLHQERKSPRPRRHRRYPQPKCLSRGSGQQREFPLVVELEPAALQYTVQKGTVLPVSFISEISWQ